MEERTWPNRDSRHLLSLMQPSDNPSCGFLCGQDDDGKQQDHGASRPQLKKPMQGHISLQCKNAVVHVGEGITSQIATARSVAVLPWLYGFAWRGERAETCSAFERPRTGD